MHKAKKNPSFMGEIMAKIAFKEDQRQLIKKAVEVKNDFNYIIDSAQAVADDINTSSGDQVTARAV